MTSILLNHPIIGKESSIYFNIPTIPSFTKQESSVSNKVLDEFIHTYVENFLHDYIHGNIRPDNECIDRSPMIKDLMHEIKTTWNLSNEEIKERDILNKALDKYVKTAIKGYYIFLNKKYCIPTPKNIKKRSNRSLEVIENIVPYKTQEGKIVITKEFKCLAKAVLMGLEKDFPYLTDLKLSKKFTDRLVTYLDTVNEELNSLKSEALQIKNQKTGLMMSIEDYIKKINMNDEARQELKALKIEFLKRNHLLFLAYKE